MYKYSFLLFFLLPAIARAQTGSLQQLLTGIGGFLNNIIIPFILAIAFIVFVVNVVRFFVIGGATDDGQKNAKNLAIYGIGAFVFILSFWGMVNLLTDGIGLTGDPCYPISDYIRPGDGTSCPPPSGVTGTAPTQPTSPDAPPSLPTLPTPSPTPPPTTVPTPPSLPSPIDSFTPDGSPFTPAITTLSGLQQQIFNLSKQYLESDINTPFGRNATLVKEALLKQITQPVSPTNSYYDQAVAAYRLNQLGVIPDAQLDEFITNVNEYDKAIGTPRPPLTREYLQANITPITPEIRANIDTTKITIATIIDNYNARAALFSTPINKQEFINSIYDSNLSINDRRERFNAYIDGDQTIFTPNDISVYDEFMDDLNAEAIFSHQFSSIN